MPERAATPEPLVVTRRSLLGVAAAGAALARTGPRTAAWAAAPVSAAPVSADSGSGIPAPGRPLTDERAATTYNNYDEFGTGKDIWQAAQALPQRPWTIRIEGMVERPRTLDIDDLLKQLPQEQRVYRHRCVEAWAMTVPWTGFALRKLLALAAPLASARYVTFTTVQAPQMSGITEEAYFPWPYLEGLTMAEAANDLAFLVTGMYGKPLPAQNGGPLRLAVPWKYGFKSAKAIGTIGFTDRQPVNFWQAIAPEEYGFWANVNPAVPHPRWSQASERLLGSDEMVPTQIYNGYGDQVAGLYATMTNERIFY